MSIKNLKLLNVIIKTLGKGKKKVLTCTEPAWRDYNESPGLLLYSSVSTFLTRPADHSSMSVTPTPACGLSRSSPWSVGSAMLVLIYLLTDLTFYADLPVSFIISVSFDTFAIYQAITALLLKEASVLCHDILLAAVNKFEIGFISYPCSEQSQQYN